MDLIVDFPAQSRRTSNAAPHSPRVTFADHSEVALIADLSKEFKSDLWFSNEEMKTFKRNYKNAFARNLKAMSSSSSTSEPDRAAGSCPASDPSDRILKQLAEDSSAYLGLESSLDRSTVPQIARCRRTLWAIVLSEQDRQRGAGVCDPEAFAKLSARASEWSRTRARAIGLLHEKR